MTSFLVRLRDHIKDPSRTTTMSRYRPRSGPLFPPAAPAVVDAAEATLGFALSPLLREVYCQVANGGFGPGYGIYGLHGGYLRRDPHGQDVPPETLVDVYLACAPIGPSLTDSHHDFTHNEALPLRSKTGHMRQWPRELVEICTWGDDLYSCIDCSDPHFPVFLHIAYDEAIAPQRPTFAGWLQDWLDDRLELSLQ